MMTQDETECLAWNIAAKAANVRAHNPEELGLFLFLEAIDERSCGFQRAASEIFELFPHRFSQLRKRIEKSYLDFKGPIDDWEHYIRKDIENRITGAIRDYVAGPNFKDNDISKLLHEYRRIYAERRQEDFVHTTVSRSLFETLDYALESRESAPIVFAEGPPSIGKTTALVAWTAQHLTDARLVSAKGINSKTTWMRTLSESLRLPVARSASGAAAQQGRIEHFLRETKIMLVIDRAEHLFPKSNRVNAHPSLLDFLCTLQDDGVPIALISWGKVFGERLRAIEESTSWSASLFTGRIMKFTSLGNPSIDDCANVARRLLPEACANGIRLISKIAFETRRYLQAVTDLASEARRIAKRQGRSEVTFKDVQIATEQRVNSEAALRRMFSGGSSQKVQSPAPEDKLAMPNTPEIPGQRQVKPSEIVERNTTPILV